MNFYSYINVPPALFKVAYIDTGLVSVSNHDEFPLSIYTYSRKAVYEDVWDNVTSKCRGIIVNNETGDIIARPFEKFHNYGSHQAVEQALPLDDYPTVWEKLDGFLITAYRWNGIWYAASKGSFHSPHAKWATAELRRYPMLFPKDSTPVFEGLHPDLRIVVDYGKRCELVLLAVIDNETGEELEPQQLGCIGVPQGFKIPRSWDKAMSQVVREANERREDKLGADEEGYVLTWYRVGAPPVRLKVKFIEYLRLHRILTGVSPKRIWEALSNGWVSEIDEWMCDSTPWFAAFAKRWVKALKGEFDRQKRTAERIYLATDRRLRVGGNLPRERKVWAAEFTKPEHKEFSSILFSMLDNKPVDAVIWKRVKGMTSGSRPMVDAHNT